MQQGLGNEFGFVLNLLLFVIVSQVYKKTCEYVKSGYGTEKVKIKCSNKFFILFY